MTLNVSPLDIRYSQDSISYRFQDGNLLTTTFARLISGQLSVESLPPVECFPKDGNWYVSYGNRRLFLYKKLREAGVISNITVLIGSTGGGNFTTTCNGLSIECRDPMVESEIQNIISQWKKGENVVAKWKAAPVPSYLYNKKLDPYATSDSD